MLKNIFARLSFFICFQSLFVIIPVCGMRVCDSGIIENVEKDVFSPVDYEISQDNFEYISNLRLYGAGLNVLSYNEVTLVNNIFPVGRGSQYLNGRQCLEVCDLIAGSLGVNYRDVSDAVNAIRLRGPTILRYSDYIGLKFQEIKEELHKYLNAIKYFGVEYVDNDQNFVLAARRRIGDLQPEYAADLRAYTDRYENLIKFLTFLDAFFEAAHLIGVDTSGTINDVVNTAIQGANNLCFRYMNCVNDAYLSAFGDAFTPGELSILTRDPLSCAQRISCNHAQFAHTEYELMFYINGRVDGVSDMHAVSYNDLCINCERLWAQNSVNNVLFVSLHQYCDSRTRKRPPRTTNKNLREVHIQ